MNTRVIINTDKCHLSHPSGANFPLIEIGKFKLTPLLIKQRQAATNYLYHLFGCPVEEALFEDDYFKTVTHALRITNNSYTASKTTMIDIVANCKAETNYEPSPRSPTHFSSWDT